MPLPAVPIVAAGSSLLLKIASVSFIIHIVVKVIAALGFGVFAFVGIDLALDALNGQLTGYLGNFPLSVKQLLDMSGITTIIFWIIQAYGLRALMQAGRAFFGRTSKMST